MIEVVYFFLSCGELFHIKATNLYLMGSRFEPEMYPVFYVERKIFRICQFSYRKDHISRIFFLIL